MIVNQVKDWETRKLLDVCEYIQPGFAQGEKDVKDGIIHLRMNNIGTNFKINFELVRTINATTAEIKKYSLRYGDLVFNNTNSSELVGKSAIFKEKTKMCLYSNHLTRLQVRKDTVLSEWVLYYIRKLWLAGEFKKMCNKWINQAAVNSEKIKNLEIPIPPLDVQEKIVQKLECVLGQLEGKKKKILELEKHKTTLLFAENYQRKGKNFVPNFLRSLQNSILRNMYEQTSEGVLNRNKHECKNISISEACDLISGQHILQENYNLKKLGIPYLTGPDDFGEQYPNITKWTEKPKAIAKKNDILITVKGAGVGKINILGIEQAAISRQLMAIRPKKCNYEYLYYFLLLNYEHIKKIGIGTTVPGIDRESILQISFPFPTLEIQNACVNDIKKKMKMLDVFRNHLPSILDRYDLIHKHLEYLPNKILEQAFSGNLVN